MIVLLCIVLFSMVLLSNIAQEFYKRRMSDAMIDQLMGGSKSKPALIIAEAIIFVIAYLIAWSYIIMWVMSW